MAHPINKPIELGKQRELFVDKEFFINTGNAQIVMHRPQPKELAIFRDTVADDSATSYYNIIYAEGKYIAYYTAHGFGKNKKGNWPHQHICRMESEDGMHWVKPNYGIYEFRGTTENNIVYLFDDDILDNFCVQYDTNPKCPPEEKYKALAERVFEPGVAVLNAVVSPDGIHWTDKGTVIRKGTFDSLNTFYYDAEQDLYHAYVRGWVVHNPSRHLGETGDTDTVVDDGKRARAIFTATSKDFYNWTEPVVLEYGDAPGYQLYTNNIAPYYRAPQYIFGFPTRYYERTWRRMFEELPNADRRLPGKHNGTRCGVALSDGLFMTSRDGYNFHRFDSTPFFPSGIESDGNWVYGDAYPAHGMVETPSDEKNAPNEISMFVPDNNAGALRRHVIRLDGFASLHTEYPGETLVTKQFVFDGNRLEFNYRTTIAGFFKVELCDENGDPFPGYSFEDCDEMFGDTVARDVSWHGVFDLSAIKGHTVTMKIFARECDFFSFRFHN